MISMTTHPYSKGKEKVLSGISIAGRVKHDPKDFYETPVWATEKLLEKETFGEEIWEPACGHCAISKVCEKRGYKVLSTDLITERDFFFEPVRGLDIITNPPFNKAEEFVRQALRVGGKKVAMFLKLTFLESESRYHLFQSTQLKAVYVFCKRVNLYLNGEKPPVNSGTIAFAWFVWDKEYIGEPVIRWLI